MKLQLNNHTSFTLFFFASKWLLSSFQCMTIVIRKGDFHSSWFMVLSSKFMVSKFFDNDGFVSIV